MSWLDGTDIPFIWERDEYGFNIKTYYGDPDKILPKDIDKKSLEFVEEAKKNDVPVSIPLRKVPAIYSKTGEVIEESKLEPVTISEFVAEASAYVAAEPVVEEAEEEAKEKKK